MTVMKLYIMNGFAMKYQMMLAETVNNLLDRKVGW